MLASNTYFDKINFNGGNLSSDGGAILIMEFLKSFSLPSLFKNIPFSDYRNNPSFSNADILNQCICRNILGYHNQSDQKVLLEDPLLSQYTKACSQSSVSRFFDRVTFSTCASFRQIITELACNYVNKYIESPILDADSTLVTTDGNQEAASYIHHYSEVGYHPLCINESNSKLLLSSLLRTGSAYSSNGIVELLKTGTTMAIFVSEVTVHSIQQNSCNIWRKIRLHTIFVQRILMLYIKPQKQTYMKKI